MPKTKEIKDCPLGYGVEEYEHTFNCPSLHLLPAYINKDGSCQQLINGGCPVDKKNIKPTESLTKDY